MRPSVLLSFFLVSCFGFSQNENSLLYRISGNGIMAPSYIFGTIHISCDATLDPAVKKALDETTQMYLELDLNDTEMQTKMMNTIKMKDGVTISSLLPAEEYTILDNYLMSKLNVSAKTFDTYKPFVLSSMFLTSLLDCPSQSLESELAKMSSNQQEPVFGLETVEEQMDIFDQIPYQLQAQELIKSIKNNFKADKIELNKLLKAYSEKDLTAMQRLTKESENKMMIDYEDLLLINRNKNWMSIIKRVSKDQATFFGVGAAHLMGNEGIISTLRNNGYLVEAL